MTDETRTECPGCGSQLDEGFRICSTCSRATELEMAFRLLEEVREIKGLLRRILADAESKNP